MTARMPTSGAYDWYRPVGVSPVPGDIVVATIARRVASVPGKSTRRRLHDGPLSRPGGISCYAGIATNIWPSRFRNGRGWSVVARCASAELHAACKARGLLHLIYAGFARRHYGLRAMRDRGYSPILLRDATSAIETRATIGSLSLTRAVILDIERWFYTALTDDLIAAFGDA